MPATVLATLTFDDCLELLKQGAALVDLRGVDDYLDVHIPGSLLLTYEAGPGLAARARDCLPLDLPLILSDPGDVDVHHAAASLRAKGFEVSGRIEDALTAWSRHAPPASTDVAEGPRPPGLVLHVGDPGAAVPEGDDVCHIPIERLWHRAHELADRDRVVIAAGYGIRAGLAVGMLERAGVGEIVFWRANPLRSPWP
jgi:rhodanese-related sulfurtransferase